MKDWKKVKISDLGNVITGNTPPRMNPEFYGNHTIFIKPTDIQEDVRYTRNPEECYSDMGYKKYIKSLIPKGSTCVVTIGSIGKKITQAHCDCFVNQAINAIVPNDFYDNDFIFYLLKNNLNQVKGLDSGTASGRENVSKSTFSSIEMFVPESIETQQKIASILSAYDDLIENNLRRIKLLEEMAAITYKEWFINNSLSNRVINEKEIEFQAIENILDFSMNGGWGKDESEGNDIIPAYVVRGTDIPNVLKGNFTNLPLRFHSVKNIETRELKYGDVIIEISNGNINSIGRSLFCDKDFLKMFNHKVICASFCKMLRAKDNLKSILLDAHIKYLHKTDKMSVYKSQGANGINNFRSDEMIKKENIPFPINRDDLKLLANGLEIFNTLNSNLRYQNRLLKESRDILLPRLMSGAVNLTQ